MINLLATTIQTIPDFSMSLDFLGKFARAIIEGVGSLGLGIILFTLVLKAITLPFDIYQRYKTRKQTLIMKAMKDDLDKLQKQYANDKTTYNMKMQELYKKNGYSVFGACLPMLISLVILIVAFQGFNSYSRYATVHLFVNMKEEYNAAILEHGPGGEDNVDYLVGDGENDIPRSSITDEETVYKEENGLKYTIVYEAVNTPVFDESGVPMSEDGKSKTQEVLTPYLRVEALETVEHDNTFLYYQYRLASYRLTEQNGTVTKELLPETEAKRTYYFAEDGEGFLIDRFLAKGAENSAENSAEKSAWDKLSAAETDSGKEQIRLDYLVGVGAQRAADWYHTKGNNAGFLWIKNVWYSDASYQHPVPAATVSADLPQELYDDLTAGLETEKTAANGYYILIVLSIGMMALSQFISMRSQKESAQYQTVDGQGAMSQKVMLVMMPLIFAVFAFLYSAAFSIYMVVSTVISLLVTVFCNLALGHIFRKKEEAEIKARYTRDVPWKKGENKKKRK